MPPTDTESPLDGLDWDEAVAHLKRCEEAYTSIGTPGSLVINTVLRPLRDRYNNGERTEHLHREILRVGL